MHKTKKKNYKKEKSRYRDPKLETTTLAPPKQHQKISFSISDASKKKIVHNWRRPHDHRS
jgi:hypothetical protein